MRALTFALVLWIALAGSVLAWNADAHTRERTHTYPAVVKCSGMAEDTAGHVYLAHYRVTGDDVLHIVYHCRHHGY